MEYRYVKQKPAGTEGCWEEMSEAWQRLLNREFGTKRLMFFHF